MFCKKKNKKKTIKTTFCIVFFLADVFFKKNMFLKKNGVVFFDVTTLALAMLIIYSFENSCFCMY